MGMLLALILGWAERNMCRLLLPPTCEVSFLATLDYDRAFKNLIHISMNYLPSTLNLSLLHNLLEPELVSDGAFSMLPLPVFSLPSSLLSLKVQYHKIILLLMEIRISLMKHFTMLLNR
jgi:hypothetical protein